MIALIRPVLFSFLKSEKVKLLIVDMLTKLAESTDNDIDDKLLSSFATACSLLSLSDGLR